MPRKQLQERNIDQAEKFSSDQKASQIGGARGQGLGGQGEQVRDGCPKRTTYQGGSGSHRAV